MANISRVKTWVAGETLTAADLNAEYNNILNAYNLLDTDYYLEHGADGTHDNTLVAMLAGTQELTGDKTLSGATTLSDVKMLKLTKGADVVSEAALFTTAGFPTDGNFVDVTGTTEITSIITSGRIGTEMTLQFDGALTITHHATDLILPGGGNITTYAGQVLKLIEYASGDWILISSNRATVFDPVATNWPSFSVHRNGVNQTTSAETKVRWTTEDFDTNNNFEHDADDSGGATESRFTPTVSGYYLLSCCLQGVAMLDGEFLTVALFKNGTVIKQATNWQSISGSGEMSAGVTAIINANGTTDYFEVFVLIDNNRVINGSSTYSFWTGCRIG